MKNISILFISSLIVTQFAFATEPSSATSQVSKTSVTAPTAESTLKTSYNIRMNALLALNGNWNIDFNFPVSDSLTLGPTLLYYKGTRTGKMSEGDVITDQYSSKLTAMSFGVLANWYPFVKRTEAGLLVSAYLRGVPASVSGQRNGNVVSGSFFGTEVGMMLSHQFIWSNGLNFTLGGGLSYYLTGFPKTINTASTELPSTSGIFDSKWMPMIDASVGYMF